MKISIKELTAVAAISLLAVGCGGSSDAEADGDSGGGSTAVASNDKLAEGLIGYWSPDPEAMIKMAMEKTPGAAALDEAMMAQMKEQMTAMAKQMVIHFDGKNTTMYGPGAPENATYEITSTDPATNTINAKITGPDGKVEDGVAKLDGDKLSLVKDGEGLDLLRITEADFKERVPNAK